MKLVKSVLTLAHIFIIIAFFGQTGLVAHWSFDELSNNQFNNLVDGQPGGIVYGCQLVTGPVGNALSFDGVNDYAGIPGDNQEPPSALERLSVGSISLWFRVDQIPTSYGIRPIFYYGQQNACDFFDAANGGMIIEVGHSPIHNGSKRLYFTEWTNGCTYPSFCYDSWNPIEEGKWYHYVAIVGENFNTGYLNGQEMHDRKYNFGWTHTQEFFSDALTPEQLWIGKGFWDTKDMYFKGAIDEIKIFDHPLNQQEVNELYAEGVQVSVESQQFKDENYIKIYPNPSQSMVNLEFNKSIISQYNFKVYSSSGKLIFQAEDVGNATAIDLSTIQSGIYVYVIEENGRAVQTEKLIIQ